MLSGDDKKRIHVVSFSGGRTSAYLVHEMEMKRRLYGWDVHYVFMDTGAEHPATYQFIKDIVKYWGIDLVCIRVVVNPKMNVGVTYRVIGLDELKQDLQPWRDMLAKYGQPTINTPFCTSRMKTEPHDKYCDDTFGRGNYDTWLGIRWDEEQRLTHFSVMKDMFDEKPLQLRPIRYLAELSKKGKPQILDWWKQQPFDLGIEEHCGNCVFCIKKAGAKLWLAAKEHPEMAVAFRDVTMSDSVRIRENDVHGKGVLYRNHMNMDDIIKLGNALPENTLKEDVAQAIRDSADESTLCSESCEVISADDFELEMQLDEAS